MRRAGIAPDEAVERVTIGPEIDLAGTKTRRLVRTAQRQRPWVVDMKTGALLRKP